MYSLLCGIAYCDWSILGAVLYSSLCLAKFEISSHPINLGDSLFVLVSVTVTSLSWSVQ